MTAHACRAFDPDCYRCDLRQDETRNLSPDCGVIKHTACSGDAWDHNEDQPTDCECHCHRPITT